MGQRMGAVVNDDQIIGVARGIEAHLESIVGADDAGQLRSRLIPLLRQADRGESVGDDVLEVLVADARVREVAADRLDERDTLLAGYPGGPPGEPIVTAPLTYGCGQCDYRYPVFEVGEPVPGCPRGHGALHRVG